MGWAAGYIAKLKLGETVSFRPCGGSMSPKIESGQLCTVAPVAPTQVRVGDIVLCKVRGAEYLHLVKAIQGSRFQIGNNRGWAEAYCADRADARATISDLVVKGGFPPFLLPLVTFEALHARQRAQQQSTVEGAATVN